MPSNKNVQSRGRGRGTSRGRGRGGTRRGPTVEPSNDQHGENSPERGSGAGRGRSSTTGRGPTVEPSNDQHGSNSSERRSGAVRGCGTSRGRGRGSRGRGLTLEPVLENIRAECRVTQRRISQLSVENKKEFIQRKRRVELQRVLLPDAPPRKRRTRNESPDREDCVFEEPTERQTDMLDLDLSIENQSRPASAESPLIVIEIIDQAGDVQIDEENLITIDDIAEVPSVPSTSKKQSVIGVTDSRFDATIDSWLADLSDMEDVDSDEEGCAFPIFTSHNALTELASSADLTPREMRILDSEDAANDNALHEIVPNNENTYEFQWKKEIATFTGKQEPFSETVGPTFDLNEDTSATDIFYKMFDVEFIDHLCSETNRYAIQKIALLKDQGKLHLNSRLNRWTPTDRDEMIAFLALMILQGLYPLPEEEKYFSFNGFGTMQNFPKIMTYNRYFLLKSMLHFVDNQTITNPSKLSKIEPVVDYFNNKFSTLYYPAREIAIDESLLKWHGRLSFSQKILSKAAKVGIKTYELCESKTGYLWKFFVYAGKQKNNTTNVTIDRPDDELNEETIDRQDNVTNDRPEDETIDRHNNVTNDRPEDETIDRHNNVTNDRPEDETIDRHNNVTNDRPEDETIDRHNNVTNDRPEDETIDRHNNDHTEETNDETIHGTNAETVTEARNSVTCPSNATSKIVYNLVEPLLNRGHTLVMDNFYNAPLLARYLKKQKTDCFGTLRLNREFVPTSVKTLNKSDLRHGEVVASYTSDLSVMVWRDSNLVSMISTYHPLRIGTNRKYNRLTYKPSIVLDYNKSMGGIDRKDQFLSAHPIERVRNRVWYKKLFRRLFSTAIFNCFILFSSRNSKISHRQFRTVLAESLIKIHKKIDLTTETRMITYRQGQQQTTRFISNSRKLQYRPDVEQDHFPVRTGTKKTRCWMCAKNKVDTRTVWKCKQCNVNLCIYVCFRAYHKPQEFPI